MRLRVAGVACWLAVAVVLVTGCGDRGDRCRKCGMFVEEHPRWIAGLTNASGEEERFCCERCMFAHWRSAQGEGGSGAWVTEYYSQQRRSVDEVLFVIGSDVVGPMGRSMVPIAGRSAAEAFSRDHRGSRILTADEITAEVLREVSGQ